MIALELMFPAGRFHATPWDRAVNEGDVEWPPSPWRVLRALVAGHANTTTEHGPGFARLLDRLAGPPRYLLPPGTTGHTRHYVPLGSMERTLVIDAFVAIERTARAYIVWDDVELVADEREELSRACSGIAYLGRAESWCIVQTADAVPTDSDLIPADLASRGITTGPLVRRLGAAADCRGAGLLTALEETTAAMRRRRRLLPAGAAWYDYRLPEGFGLAPSIETRAQRVRGAGLPPKACLRFVLEAERDGLRPPVSETLKIAETFRASMMKNYSSITGESAPWQITGKSGDEPLKGHDHAFILPRDLDDDGKIDHVDVLFPAGACHNVFSAARSVTRLFHWAAGLNEAYELTYLASAPQNRGRVWRTATPFLLGAHPRTRGSAARRARYEPEGQLRRSLAEHGFPEPAGIDFWPRPNALRHATGGRTLLASFRCARERKGDAPIGLPLGVTVTFSEEVTGPIAVGRYAHFGLGQFTPDDV